MTSGSTKGHLPFTPGDKPIDGWDDDWAEAPPEVKLRTEALPKAVSNSLRFTDYLLVKLIPPGLQLRNHIVPESVHLTAAFGNVVKAESLVA
jgi:hypothetical protein